MAFKMGVSKADLSGPPPVPNGQYELRLVSFRPKLTKNGDGINYNAEFSIQHPQYNERRVFHPLSTNFFQAIWDFCHACGVETELVKVTNDAGELEEIEVLPGKFENQENFPEEPDKWGKYMGPLTNAVCKVELVTTSYQGRDKNEIRMFFCALKDCYVKNPKVKHSMNLIKAS